MSPKDLNVVARVFSCLVLAGTLFLAASLFVYTDNFRLTNDSYVIRLRNFTTKLESGDLQVDRSEIIKHFREEISSEAALSTADDSYRRLLYSIAGSLLVLSALQGIVVIRVFSTKGSKEQDET